jgi:hypothetical protein
VPLSAKCLTIQAVSRKGAGKKEVARDVGRVAWRKNPVKGGLLTASRQACAVQAVLNSLTYAFIWNGHDSNRSAWGVIKVV